MKSFAKFLFLLALTQGESPKKSYRMFLKKKTDVLFGLYLFNVLKSAKTQLSLSAFFLLVLRTKCNIL